MKQEDSNEMELKKNYFSAERELKKFLCNKYWKYKGKPVILKARQYPKQKERIGWYVEHRMPIFINDALIHVVDFGKVKYCLGEGDFEIYKKKIKNKNGETIHFVDVKCAVCSHVNLVDMRYLVWKYNCKKCLTTLTINNRVKKSKIHSNEYR